MDVLVVDHPLARARLTTMRDATTDSAAFRAALHELTVMLIYEAMRDAPLRTERIHTPVAQMGFVGVSRDETTLRPTPYMESLPERLAGRPVFVLDPMLATGGSMEHTIRLLTDRGATDVTAVCALAAPEGIRRLEQSGLPVRLVTASVDERLNDSGFIVPGLGDAGDRQYGTV